jgi:uncharacterized membrane protein
MSDFMMSLKFGGGPLEKLMQGMLGHCISDLLVTAPQTVLE